MSSPFDWLFHGVHVGLLRLASTIVPASHRSEWIREWSAELWHVRRSCIPIGAFSWAAQREITSFCLGAFPDSICVRRQSGKGEASSLHVHGSAGQCLLWLLTVLIVCVVIAQLIPGIQAESDAGRYRIHSGLLLIQDSNSGVHEQPAISLELYQNWKATRQRYFDNFAFYRPTREPAPVPSKRGVWSVALATYNLFPVLGLPVQLASPSRLEESDLAPAILSHETWMRDFGGDPRVTGRVVRLRGRQVRIAGVVPCGAWHLPGQPDVWVLESDSQVAADAPAGASGYVIAHLSAIGESQSLGEHVPIAARGIDLDGTLIEGPVQGPWSIYWFALLLAVLTLPAVTSVSADESSFSSHRPSWKRRLYRSLFLVLKLVLVAAIAGFLSLDLAYWRITDYSPGAECVQLVSTFTICLFGFRWAMVDQRTRCPVCLRCVTHPARVGIASRTFLGWNGTELVCMGGHTVLHVPSLPTSWFSGQRWLYLDSSWEFLFADSGVW